LDAQLAPLVSRGWTKVAPHLQDILRIGAYQLTALDRVPAHAAVDTSVSLAKTRSGARAAGFVNAILRGLTRTDAATLGIDSTDAAGLAKEYSHPVWLVRRWLAQFGQEETRVLLKWNNTRPRLVIQPARVELSVLTDRLRRAGIEVEQAPYGAGLIVASSHPTDLPGFAEGWFVVQNPAQGLLTSFAGIPPTWTVYDGCGAPGGKSIALGRTGRMVLAGDISRARAQRLQRNLARAGSGREHIVVADARQPPVESVQGVLLDVPCLGTGTFGRHPDARWKVRAQDLDSLVRLQGELFDAAAKVVAPGGLLVYSTCSLEPEENREQVNQFLENHAGFRREPSLTLPSELLSPEGDLMVLPQRHGVDGAYAARLRRST
jgi:16S rRNA (cytosine967-C5)-methyltransferase